MSDKNDLYLEFLKARRLRILEMVADTCKRAGRNPDEILTMAVSKNRSAQEVFCAWQAGWHTFGENRPQELSRKLKELEVYPQMAEARFDMIGNLQTNKINQLLGKVTLIHSVSHAALARAISERSERKGLITDVLLEVNVSGELTKGGFSKTELVQALDELLELPGINILGIMTMAPAGDPDGARKTFSDALALTETIKARSALKLPIRSWGMSDDFEIGIEEGSTLIRVGRCVFDKEYDM